MLQNDTAKYMTGAHHHHYYCMGSRQSLVPRVVPARSRLVSTRRIGWAIYGYDYSLRFFRDSYNLSNSKEARAIMTSAPVIFSRQ